VTAVASRSAAPVSRRRRPAPIATPATPTGLPRLWALSAGGPSTLEAHLARYGPVPWRGRPQRGAGPLVATVEAAGLTGRGGAGFPMARKLAAVSRGTRPPVVVANGTEGEPASRKDRTLLRLSPHLVLDGASLAAEAVGAPEVVVVVHEDVLAVVRAAAEERRAVGLDRAELRVVPAARGFVGGEETAVVQWVQRGVARPTSTPPRPFERGLDRRPTLVQNVETLAHLALLARYGDGWFRAIGTADEPGSMLVTVLGEVAAPGVLEVPLGLPVGSVLEMAGGARSPLGTLLLGGYFGTFVRAADAMARPFSRKGLEPIGASPGAGLIVALPEHACGLSEAARVVNYLAAQSAGQCGPCVYGLAAIAADFQLLARPGDAAFVDCERLWRWLGQVAGRGGCRHPDGSARLVASALATFADEVEAHAWGRCTAVER
jgi:NADH:ubiquinone oxidoreductase subunit F (NADH-binding)